jgi:signal peptidase I
MKPHQSQSHLAQNTSLLKILIRLLFKTLKTAVILGVFIPLIVITTLNIFSYVFQKLNLGNEIVLISGTGSMHPTFAKGIGVTPEQLSREIVSTPGMIRYPRGISFGEVDIFKYLIQRGDIVAFNNEATRQLTQKLSGSQSSFIKRAIALPGDTVEIREGILYLNNEPQLEPYTARARSTFGGEFLPECTKLTVGENQLFVLGDNRTGSNDSRHELGLVSLSDVHNVIPWQDQVNNLDQHWRDTSQDLSDSAVISLNIDEYIKLINQEREKNQLQPLKINLKLNESARLRGKKILEFGDFSTEASISGYPMKKAIQDAGYSNIIWGEAVVQGYFEAKELLEQQLAFVDSKDFLLTPEYSDIGVAVVLGEVNNCPTQVIVRHFGGYIPPNYEASIVKSWQNSLKNLKEIQPSWEDSTEAGELYENNQEKIDRIREIISYRIKMQSQIVAKLESNQWLNDELNTYASTTDSQLAKEQVKLNQELNQSL